MACPYASYKCLLHRARQWWRCSFDPLKLALVVLIFHHCAHVLLGTSGGLKGAGVGPSLQQLALVVCFFFPKAVAHILNACIVICVVVVEVVVVVVVVVGRNIVTCTV